MPSVGASRSRNEEEREQRMNRKSLSNSWPDQGIGMDDGPSSSSNAGRKKMDLMLGELPGSKSYLMCGVSNLVCSHFCLRERRICEGEMSMKVLGTNFIYNESPRAVIKITSLILFFLLLQIPSMTSMQFLNTTSLRPTNPISLPVPPPSHPSP